MIQRIKDEEAKLLDEVEDFERAEAAMLGEKTSRLKHLESMGRFSSISTNLLAKYLEL